MGLAVLGALLPLGEAGVAVGGPVRVPTSARADASGGAALTLVSFNVTPRLSRPGERVEFAASVSGGAPPYRYDYFGLPRNCPSVSAPNLTCAPTARGVYVVEVTVSDSTDAAVMGFATLHVTGGFVGPLGLSLVALSLIALGLTIVGVIAAVGILFWYRRRAARRSREEPPGEIFRPPPGAE